jgi:hypothetical protein
VQRITLAICKVLGSTMHVITPTISPASPRLSTHPHIDSPVILIPILVIGYDPLLFQDFVQLRPGTVQDDGVETEPVQKGKGEGEVVQLVGEDCTADPAKREAS